MTNDLYRKCRKVQARCVHNGFPNECSTVGLVGGSKPGSKSLFRKILSISPCGSRFWQDQDPSPSHKSFEIRILEEWGEKKVGDPFTLRPHAGSIALVGQAPSSALTLLGTRALPDNLQAAPHSIHRFSPIASATSDLRSGSRSEAKSLFQNISPVSPCGSGFWQDRDPSPFPKSFEIKILEEWGEKKVGSHFTIRPHAGSIALAGQAPSSALALLRTRALPDNLQAARLSIHGLSPIPSATSDLRGASKSETKSLFHNILPVSPCDSRFWQDRAGSMPHKPLEINILERHAKKNERSVHCARELSDKS